MTKFEKMFSALEKLYLRRTVLDKQIIDIEKKIALEKKGADKPVTQAKKPDAKKPVKPLLKK